MTKFVRWTGTALLVGLLAMTGCMAGIDAPHTQSRRLTKGDSTAKSDDSALRPNATRGGCSEEQFDNGCFQVGRGRAIFCDCPLGYEGGGDPLRTASTSGTGDAKASETKQSEASSTVSGGQSYDPALRPNATRGGCTEEQFDNGCFQIGRGHAIFCDCPLSYEGGDGIQ